MSTGVSTGAACGCGCCAGTTGLTPVHLLNRPGLSALAYRVGTHALFLETMLAEISAKPALRALTTRELDDPTVALLDAWAVTLDVLTFYQERIADEGYLRTATERLSLLELARTIGYELRPGVAAATWLAFALDGSPGSPREVVIAKGTRAQSLPAKDELPQSFETGEEIAARPEWNLLRPRLQQPQTITGTEVLLAGLATQLRPGDALLFVGGDAAAGKLRILTVVESRPKDGVTRAAWKEALTSSAPRIYALRQRAAFFGANAPDWKATTVDFQRAYTISAGYTYSATREEWPDLEMTGNVSQIDLDAAYPRIAPDSWVVLVISGRADVFSVTGVETVSRSDFSLSARVTRLSLKTTVDRTVFTTRETAVFAESEELPPAPQAITEPVEGKLIELDTLVDGLLPGRAVIVQGRPISSDSVVAEPAVLEEAPSEGGRTLLKLASPLIHSYDRATVSIFANVAPATHGETRREVLGGGDASKRFQRFKLRQKPLTYTPAPVPEGGESTLELRVNGVLWHEAHDLFQLGARDRRYVLRRDDEGATTVRFGDGLHGSRLPTGVENVEAVYRTGIGLAGLVEAERISLLATRPLGVKSVTNPVPATGGADPEARDQARRNAPTTVLTLDRIVSLRDFEDFARSFSGIGKAQARFLWDRGRRIVHLTVAGVEGRSVDAGSALDKNLRAAMDRQRDPFQTLVAESFDPVLFRVRLRVKVHPDHVAETVLARVETALREAFSFAARDFGQSVFLSEVMAVAQGAEGVVYVDVDALYKDGEAAVLRDRITALPARIDGGGQILKAQILTLSPLPVVPEAI